MVKEITFTELAKPKVKCSEVKDVMACGELLAYNSAFDKLQSKNET